MPAPSITESPFGLLKHTNCLSYPETETAASGKSSVLLHCPSMSAGGTEPLTSLISLFPAQLAYPATQSDTLPCLGQQKLQYSQTLSGATLSFHTAFLSNNYEGSNHVNFHFPNPSPRIKSGKTDQGYWTWVHMPTDIPRHYRGKVNPRGQRYKRRGQSTFLRQVTYAG